jgi:hypothetical protein
VLDFAFRRCRVADLQAGVDSQGAEMGGQESGAMDFRDNLRFLLRSRWLSQKEASDQIGVPYKWLRRLCHQGIERIDKRSKPNLETLASYFAVEVEELWGDHIQTEPPANCRVGAVEFSQEGKFITPYHLGEMGMEPKSVDALLADWHEKLKKRDVTFTVRDYRTVFSRDGDFLYLDPPYKSERSRLYLGRFDHDEFYRWLKKQRAGWALSMNGPADGDDSVPQIYDERFELQNGTSAVRRLGGLESPSVTESLFVRTGHVCL